VKQAVNRRQEKDSRKDAKAQRTKSENRVLPMNFSEQRDNHQVIPKLIFRQRFPTDFLCDFATLRDPFSSGFQMAEV